MPKQSNEKLFNVRHSLAHIMASAVMEMFPKAQLGVGPVIETGFYYDFLLPRPLTPDDIKKIEKRMRELVKQKLTFDREFLSIAEAKKLFTEHRQQFKLELIKDLEKFGTTKAAEIAQADESLAADLDLAGKTGEISVYRTGKFLDLCKGPHVQSTGEIDPLSFKLDKISGAYWRGNQANPQMQRIYGLSFESKEELEEYVKLQEEIQKRDHRVLGPKLGLFLFHELSPGIPFLQPKGTAVRNELEKFVRELSYGEGYEEVKLPQLFDSELWKISGHWDHYKDDMFTMKVEGREFALKPMNCPGHMILYKQGLYSYKDLPLRFAEMSTLFRNELTGALGGMTRTRGFAQDDCHIFLAPEQVAKEVAELLKRIKKIYRVFNMEVQEVYLSTKPEKSLGAKEDWDRAEAALAEALKQAGWEYEINPGDGAFYGPKIDMAIKDVLGRKWQLATVQLDFQMPKRFELSYVDQDGERKTPIVIHRAILGSFERFMAILIEQFAGAFPAWLSPIHAKVLPISEKQNKYAKNVMEQLKAAGIRAEIDDRNESIGKKIREAEMEKAPYMIILGEKEAEAEKISVRARNQKDLGAMKLSEFLETLKEEINERSIKSKF